MIKKEKTFVLIKPDGVQRSLIGETIKRLERAGLKLVALKLMLADADKIKQHYLLEDGWIEKTGNKSIKALASKGIDVTGKDPKKVGEEILANLIKYLGAGPVVIMVWEGAHAVTVVRKIVGATEPLSSDVGTLRGDFVIDSYELADVDKRAVRNILHASSSPKEAESEIALWFDKEDILNYRLVQEQIIYDVNLDGILE